MIRKILLIFVISQGLFGWAQALKFKVILDAGHGGKDFGAVYHGSIEKNIALKTALKVGEILEKDPQIEVVYTRKSDVFVELQQRANIANKSKGSIFVSMHCNANKNEGAAGNETYVMGITRNAANLAVAKHENEVVSLEADYKIKYDGYDPKSPESVIGINILQEEYLDQSIELADKVQQFFTKKTSNKNRGVKQAGFLVLRQITMPRVLIEMGFISNKQEGAFLNSTVGQNKLAEAIAGSIINYKKEFFASNKPSKATPVVVADKKVETPEVKEKPLVKQVLKPVAHSTKGIVFKVQISASPSDLDPTAVDFKGLYPIFKEPAGKLFKYYFAQEKKYDVIEKKLEEAKKKGFESAFVVAYKDGKKISVSEATKIK
ncbi:N-acetylmuramoyl-L-alanine amidase [Flavobacterium sp.]|jgi:N-acetylmuramoyl-L-alanine amidase|uniref:N-acetylmuramoyl-L-alanine amidase n=1 Tax=Flavobacterium sp. TaxID=239 RepID=UPI0037BF6CB0